MAKDSTKQPRASGRKPKTAAVDKAAPDKAAPETVAPAPVKRVEAAPVRPNADSNELLFVGKGDASAFLTLGLANRHGLVTGATADDLVARGIAEIRQKLN